MKPKEFNSLARAQFKRERDILFKTAPKDYGSDADRLCQFYEMAELAGVTPGQALKVAMSKHITTLFKALDGQILEKNSIEEVCADVANYSKLAFALCKEQFDIPVAPTEDTPTQ